MEIAVGVLPVPPSVKLPTQMTGMSARKPGRAHARRCDRAIDHERQATADTRRFRAYATRSAAHALDA